MYKGRTTSFRKIITSINNKYMDIYIYRFNLLTKFARIIIRNKKSEYK